MLSFKNFDFTLVLCLQMSSAASLPTQRPLADIQSISLKQATCNDVMITDLDEAFPMSVTPPRANDALVTSRWEDQIEDCDEEQITIAIVTKPSLMNVTAEQPCVWRFKCKMASGRYPASWWQAELVDQHSLMTAYLQVVTMAT